MNTSSEFLIVFDSSSVQTTSLLHKTIKVKVLYNMINRTVRLMLSLCTGASPAKGLRAPCLIGLRAPCA
uniref:Uncharacterized protein n=1 Tax=Arundo donax TaxID=35708 RepID=A0A0A9CF97_ARUDO